MPHTVKKPDRHSTMEPSSNGGNEKRTDRVAELMRANPSMTFAQMLQTEPQIMRKLKLPHWWNLLAPYERKDQASLTATEQSRLLCALSVLIADGTYGKLVDVHAEMHMQHTNDRLLPWHRIFLLQLENALRIIHPDVS